MSTESKLSKIMREPLIHFLLIGATLFFIYSESNKELVEENKNTIHITSAHLKEIEQLWMKKKGQIPSLQVKKELLDSYIKDEILYREALAKGLDKNDNTIRTHLAKKMQFVLDDLSVIKEPTQKELEEYYSKNSSKFKESASISFNQILFSKDKLTKDTQNEANSFLAKLQKSKNPKVSTIGDLVELSKKGMTNLYGEEFTSKLFGLKQKAWSGPFISKHGMHLIYVHNSNEEKTPEFSQVKEKVEQEWRKERQTEANEAFYEKLSKNYEIIVDKSGQ